MFHQLNQFVGRVASGYFSPDGSGETLKVWMPETPEEFPESRALYTVEILNGVHRGPCRNKIRDVLGNVVEQENRFSLHLLLADPPDGCPYLPVRSTTTLLVGHDFETAESCRIVDFEELAGRLELTLEKFSL